MSRLFCDRQCRFYEQIRPLWIMENLLLACPNGRVGIPMASESDGQLATPQSLSATNITCSFYHRLTLVFDGLPHMCSIAGFVCLSLFERQHSIRPQEIEKNFSINFDAGLGVNNDVFPPTCFGTSKGPSSEGTVQHPCSQDCAKKL